jgi:aryl-phospho-beta-D-glucosidase BglC (GH1 family)
MRAIIAAAFVLVGIQLVAQVGSDNQLSLASARAAQLRRGINISGWFAGVYNPESYDAAHYKSWITRKDLDLIKGWEFDFIRLGVNPEPVFRAYQPNQIPRDYLLNLEAAVRQVMDTGLAVVIVLQPDSEFKEKTLSNDALVGQLATFWVSLASYFSNVSPDRIFFEVMNEPELTDSLRWQGIQAKLAAAIRTGAPQNTIIAVGGRWSSLEGLVSLEPLADRNVIYSFHYYEPHLFTHQGATWGSYSWYWIKGLRYPSSPLEAANVASLIPEPVDRLTIIRYGYESWGADRIRSEISQARIWAQANGVPVICGEFGVYRPGARSEDRVAWITDVRTALEHSGIGWAIWDYRGNFGVVERTPSTVIVDSAILCALGTMSQCSTQ